VAAIIFAISGSFMVSYTRARAEGLGMECKAGMMQRPERITLLVIGSLLGAVPVIGILLLKLVLLALALSTNLTAAYRIMFVKNRMVRDDQAK
jgi:CDP-diacylglycerol--glycerol-3-phosphate 3-phosphatidyltransferase